MLKITINVRWKCKNVEFKSVNWGGWGWGLLLWPTLVSSTLLRRDAQKKFFFVVEPPGVVFCLVVMGVPPPPLVVRPLTKLYLCVFSLNDISEISRGCFKSFSHIRNVTVWHDDVNKIDERWFKKFCLLHCQRFVMKELKVPEFRYGPEVWQGSWVVEH